MNTRRKSLGFSIDLSVPVPEYEVDGKWFADNHYPGGYIYRDKINLEVTPASDGGWLLRYGFDSKSPNRAIHRVTGIRDSARVTFNLPIETRADPGIKASLRLVCIPWN